MKITVVGTGYVGLVTAAIFARFGNKVWGLDVDKTKIASLKQGKVPFFEPELEELVKDGMKRGNLSFTDDYSASVSGSEIVFICVGTPPKPNGDYDLSYIYEAAKSIGKAINNYTVVAIKSTVPPGTGSEVENILKKYAKSSFSVASCPEFLREGTAVWDSMHPARIVLGTGDEKAKNLLLKLHQPILAPRVLCDVVSAQLVKYAANAFLATKISFINAIARICDAIGADVTKVSEGLGLDPRISKSFLEAGLGYGGSCFPKDTWALISFARRINYDFKFLNQVDQINKDQIKYFIDKVKKLSGSSLKGKTFAALGLSFKADTDDIRESRSISVIETLLAESAVVRATDPVAIENTRKIFPDISYFSDPYQALKGASALLLLTDWKDYQNLDFGKVKRIMDKPVIIDGRNFLPADKLKKLGFIYEGIGIR